MPSKNPATVEAVAVAAAVAAAVAGAHEGVVFDLMAYPRTTPTTKEIANVVIVLRASSGVKSPVIS